MSYENIEHVLNNIAISKVEVNKRILLMYEILEHFIESKLIISDTNIGLGIISI